MKFKIQLVIEHETGQEIQELACLERGTADLASIGIVLDEAKTLLVSLQKEVVSRQLADYLAVKNKCPKCEKPFRHKDKHPAVFRTLFGNLGFSSPRWFQCNCHSHSSRTFSPLSELLTDNCSPERLYLETKWASLISFNENFITNYGERYRQGDRISSGFVESAVNYVIAKRFTKRQQMQWSPKGAHLLLQTRTCVLNGDLEQTFRKWYPKFRASNDENLKMAA